MKTEITIGDDRIGWKNNHNGECFYLGFRQSDGRWFYQHLCLDVRGNASRYYPLLAKLFRLLRRSGKPFNRKIAY